MAFDYAEAALDAADIIAEFGAAGSNNKPAIPAGQDPDPGDTTAGTAQVTINGTITPKLRYKSMQIDGVNVLATDSYVFFDTAGTPEVGILTDLNGETLRIVQIDKLQSVDGINVYHKLQLRS
jgi:hypothetical protein